MSVRPAATNPVRRRVSEASPIEPVIISTRPFGPSFDRCTGFVVIGRARKRAQIEKGGTRPSEGGSPIVPHHPTSPAGLFVTAYERCGSPCAGRRCGGTDRTLGG